MDRPSNIAAIARQTRHMTDPQFYSMTLPRPELDLPRDILLMRRSPQRQPTTKPIIHPDQYMLVLTMRGAGTAVINQIAFRLRARQAFLVFPRQFHHFTGLAGHDFLWFFCSFRLACNREIIRLRDTPTPIRKNLFPLIHALTADYCSPQRLQPRVLGRITVNLWTLLLELAAAAPASSLVENQTVHPLRDMLFLEKIQNYLVSHLHEQITATQAAKHMGMSRRSLYQQFQDIMGLGLAEYIHRLRIQRAGSLMQTTDLTISQIADQTGYHSVFSFSRAFKRAMRFSPTAYRKIRAPA